MPKINEAKIKEGIFVGLKIVEIMRSCAYGETLNEVPLGPFLGHLKAKNDELLYEERPNVYEVVGCKMSLQVTFLIHLDFFATNLDCVSDKHEGALS